MLDYNIIIIDILNKENLKDILPLTPSNKYYINTTISS
jgi:hypothetical protein